MSDYVQWRDAAADQVYSAVHEELMKLRVKLHSVLDGRSDIDSIVYHAQNRACDAAVAALKIGSATDSASEASPDTAQERSAEDSAPTETGKELPPGLRASLDPMDKRTTGLYGKFHVTRMDGKSEPGQKHDGCDYFVLDITRDPHANAALMAYADSCEAEYPLLARDLRAKVLAAVRQSALPVTVENWTPHTDPADVIQVAMD